MITAKVPAGVNAIPSRVSSMSYADVYGASDDTGPSSAVAGSVGYVDATQAMSSAGPAVGMIANDQAAGGLPALIELGHSLLDSPAGIAFLLAGGILLLAWHELA